MNRPSAILFDHDGVLVASEPVHWVAWQKLMAELGLQVPETEFHRMIGKTAPQILTDLMDRHSPGWDTSKLPEYVSRKSELYLEGALRGLQPYPGVREGLEWLRSAGIRTAVVSNARRRELVAVLESLGLAPFLDCIISREDAGVPKPDPTPYLMGAASLGFEPAQCIAVEDSPPGIESALMARIPSAAILTSFPRDVMAEPVPGRPDLRPSWILGSMIEFFDLIKQSS